MIWLFIVQFLPEFFDVKVVRKEQMFSCTESCPLSLYDGVLQQKLTDTFEDDFFWHRMERCNSSSSSNL